MNFTNHILEKFVIRTMNYTLQEAKQYLVIPENEVLVKERILKLFRSSEFLYRGALKENKEAAIYINRNSWVIIHDEKKDCLVTLYKVDLGLDEDFNRIYADKMLEKINTLKASYENETEKRKQEIHEIVEKVSDLNEEIKVTQKTLTNLTNNKDNLLQRKNLLEKEIKDLDEPLKLQIESFVSKKIF